MAIQAVIFDFGGVLIRTESQAGRQKWEAKLGLEPGGLSRAVFESETALLASLGKIPEEKIWETLAVKYNLKPDQLDELRADFWSGDRLDTALIETIRGLRSKKYKTAILSNAWSGARLLFTTQFQLDKVFDLIVISAEEGLAKPDPDLYRRVVDRLGVLPEEAIFVDDFIENVVAARDAGIHAIHFINTPQTISEINALIS